MGRTTSYCRRVGHTKIIRWINSCPSLYTAAKNEEINFWIAAITWIITEWVAKQTGASFWIGFASDSHQFFSITALGHITLVFETCKYLNCNKHSNWRFSGYGFWVFLAFAAVCDACLGWRLLNLCLCSMCSQSHAPTSPFLAFLSYIVLHVKESKSSNCKVEEKKKPTQVKTTQKWEKLLIWMRQEFLLKTNQNKAKLTLNLTMLHLLLCA